MEGQDPFSYSIQRFLGEEPENGAWTDLIPIGKNGFTSTGFSSTADTSVNGSSVHGDEERAVTARPDLTSLLPDHRLDSAGSAHGDFGGHSFGLDAPQRYSGSGEDSGEKGSSSYPTRAGGLASGNTFASTSSQSHKTPEKQYFGCFFVKHNPVRYEMVYNSCTMRPGWEEWKYLLEHVKKVHSPKFSCQKCGKSCKGPEDLERHKNNKASCKRASSSSLPEPLTADQEKVVNNNKISSLKNMDQVEKYGQFYHLLFPEDPRWQTIDPRYDYLTPTHKIPAYLQSLQSGLPSAAAHPIASQTSNTLAPGQPGQQTYRAVNRLYAPSRDITPRSPSSGSFSGGQEQYSYSDSGNFSAATYITSNPSLSGPGPSSQSEHVYTRPSFDSTQLVYRSQGVSQYLTAPSDDTNIYAAQQYAYPGSQPQNQGGNVPPGDYMPYGSNQGGMQWPPYS